MRPFLVLLLVIGALVAFYFAFTAGSREDRPDALTGDAVATDGEAPARGAVDLVRPEDGGAAAEPADTRQAAPAVETPAGSFKNRLEGQVVDPGGQGIRDARVVLSRVGQTTFYFYEDVDRSADVTTRTDDQGRFAFQNVEPFDGYALHVRHPDHGNTEVGQVAVPETGVRQEPPIVLSGGVDLVGTVRDVAGNAVGGAKIIVGQTTLGTEAPKGPDTLHTESAADGTYRVPNLAEGRYQMNVSAEGYGSTTLPNVNVAGQEDVLQDVELEVAQMIAGTVTSIGGEPIEDALVQAFSMPGRGQVSRSRTRTNDKGEFRFEDVPPGTYTVLAEEKSHRNERQQRVEAGTMGVHIQLTPLPAIAGRVVDASTAEPLETFTVRLREPADNSPVAMPLPNTNVTVKDGSGEFRVHAPKAGTYVVEASAPAYATCFSDPVTLTEGQDAAGVTVRMTKGGSILGRIVGSDGEPIAGATVFSRDNEWTDDQFMQVIGDMYPTNAVTRQVRTSSDGTFEIDALTPASYQLDIRHDNHSRHNVFDVQVMEARKTDVGNVALATGGTIEGRVYGPNGEPLPSAMVQAGSQSVSEFPANYSVKTDAKGYYRFEHVRAGIYTLKAMRSTRATSDPFEAIGDMKESQKPKVEVTDGETLSGIDFHLGGSRR